jgi:hypothetical protein
MGLALASGARQHDVRVTGAQDSDAAALRPGSVGKVHDDRGRCAPHDHPAKRLGSRGVDLHVRKEGRHMDEISGFPARRAFALRTPADFAVAGEDIGDRLLLAMMMNTCAGSRQDLEQAAPQRRSDAELRGYSRQAHRAWRLCRPAVEFGRADNANWGIVCHELTPARFRAGSAGISRSSISFQPSSCLSQPSAAHSAGCDATCPVGVGFAFAFPRNIQVCSWSR